VQTVDFTTLTAACDELRSDWVPGRVEQVYQRDRYTIALCLRTLKRRGWLTISWHPQAARICLGAPPPKTPDTFTFSDQLRHQLNGLALVAIDAIAPWERALDLQFARRPGEGATFHLYVEIMGKYSNVILTSADNLIITAAHQVSSQQSSVRPIQTGQPYEKPPALIGTTPSLSESQERWQERVSLVPGAIQRQLLKSYRGLSPALVRSMVNAAGLDPNQSTESLNSSDWQQLFKRWQEWLQTLGNPSTGSGTGESFDRLRNRGILRQAQEQGNPSTGVRTFGERSVEPRAHPSRSGTGELEEQSNVKSSNPQPSNLQPANLQPSNLQPSNLQPSNLQPANLQPSNLQPANPQPSNLQPSNLQPSNLQPANLQPSNLQPANPQPSNLQPSNLQPSNLQPNFQPGWTDEGYTVMGWGVVESAKTVQVLLDEYYTAELDRQEFAQLRHQLSQKLGSLLGKLRQKASTFEERLQQSDQADEYRQQADLLMAYLQDWKPGMKSITLVDFDTHQPVTIPLNPEKNAVQNAQALYKRHQKLKRARNAVEPLLNEVQEFSIWSKWKLP
jgi:predicted ribosome quality control (RQC) complex YloA/Tae2 family protein